MVKEFAYTSPGCSYPEYFNAKVEGHTATITVRGPIKPDGACGDCVQMQMPIGQLLMLAMEIAHELG